MRLISEILQNNALYLWFTVSLCELQKAEEQYYKENMWKVHSEWRKILRTAKAEELQNEVKSLYKNFTVKVWSSNMSFTF